MTDSSEIIFTSYCFDNKEMGDYHSQQIRLKDSILSIYPDANLNFQHESEEIGKPKFQASLYGFKVRLVQECLDKGFKKIIFFDPAITLVDKVDYWFDIIKDYGVLAATDRQPLDNVTSDNCLNYMGLTREQVSTWNLLGGSVYVFDFDIPKCVAIFEMWEKMEKDGIFGTQDDLSHGRLQAHRNDETCMAIAFELNGIKPLGHDVIRYAYEHPETKKIHHQFKEGEEVKLVILKKHFK